MPTTPLKIWIKGSSMSVLNVPTVYAKNPQNAAATNASRTNPQPAQTALLPVTNFGNFPGHTMGGNARRVMASSPTNIRAGATLAAKTNHAMGITIGSTLFQAMEKYKA